MMRVDYQLPFSRTLGTRTEAKDTYPSSRSSGTATKRKQSMILLNFPTVRDINITGRLVSP